MRAIRWRAGGNIPIGNCSQLVWFTWHKNRSRRIERLVMRRLFLLTSRVDEAEHTSQIRVTDSCKFHGSRDFAYARNTFLRVPFAIDVLE